jgi:hypothetical protein
MPKSTEMMATAVPRKTPKRKTRGLSMGGDVIEGSIAP